MTTLDTHPDFGQLVNITAQALGILPEFVVKDYWVTRILRAIATDDSLRRQVIFKGGTSLSKGWKLIDRFSEDVDLLATGPEFSDPPGDKARERLFKAIRSRIERETPLRLPEPGGVPPGERNFFYLRGPYKCDIRYSLPGRVIDRSSPYTDFVFLEMGFRGGPNPHVAAALNSFVGEYVLSLAADQRSALADYREDFTAFEMELLDPVRTFVEKLLVLHGSLAKGTKGVRTRHFYDLDSLFRKSDSVRASLRSDQFPALVNDAVRITREYFDPDLDPDLNLAESPVLDLTAEQIDALTILYRGERDYYFGGQPPFSELVATLAEVRSVLRGH